MGDEGDPAHDQNGVQPPERRVRPPGRLFRHPRKQRAEAPPHERKLLPRVPVRPDPRPLEQVAGHDQRGNQEEDQAVFPDDGERRGFLHVPAPGGHAETGQDQEAGQFARHRKEDVHPPLEDLEIEAEQEVAVDLDHDDQGGDKEHEEGVKEQAVHQPREEVAAHPVLEKHLAQEDFQALPPVGEPLAVLPAPAPGPHAPEDAPGADGDGRGKQQVHHPGMGDIPHQGAGGFGKGGHASNLSFLVVHCPESRGAASVGRTHFHLITK